MHGGLLSPAPQPEKPVIYTVDIPETFSGDIERRQRAAGGQPPPPLLSLSPVAVNLPWNKYL